MKHLESISESLADIFVDKLQVYQTQTETVKPKLPTNAVVISADIFSELVNMASYIGRVDEQYIGLYDRMLEDVKKNSELVDRIPPIHKNKTESNASKGQDKEINKKKYDFRQLLEDLDKVEINDKRLEDPFQILNDVLQQIGRK